MNGELRSLLERGGGLLTRAAALQVVPRWVLDGAVHDGGLVAVLPGVYTGGPHGATGALAGLPADLRLRAVTRYAAGRGALSGPSALHVWGLRAQPAGEPVHLDVPRASGLRSRGSLVVHQRSGFAVRPVVSRGGLPVTGLEHSPVDAWPLLPPADRAGPVIGAVNDRLTTPQRIGAALATAPRLGHRAGLRALVRRLAAGCRSPLEIWGHDRVFAGPEMSAFRRQVRLRVEGRTYYLDMYAESERVNVELDGAATHGLAGQREIDLRRDALLATVGIVVLRFSHRRLVHERDQVRREVVAVLASRRVSQDAGVA